MSKNAENRKLSIIKIYSENAGLEKHQPSYDFRTDQACDVVFITYFRIVHIVEHRLHGCLK